MTQPDPRVFAESVRALLNEDVRRYRNFGVYWFAVKAVLKRYFDRNEMPILGNYVAESVVSRMPEGLDMGDVLAAAAGEYQENASFNLGRNRLSDPSGEFFTLIDPDVEG
ncbi:hypothetical protein [Parvibaculum sp.]|uniref:hypothetical protein n=1 Tax=Parvibaculum sp. TaxID=2024848 RepID=UPI0027337F67|nr:hypothetical protein [Parvibaculum sp.]MDP3327186.1 hypothetical protein [Parvibaculum sp.]